MKTIRGAVLTDPTAGHVILLNGGVFYRGVPRYDLTEEQLAALPPHSFAIVEKSEGDDTEEGAPAEIAAPEAQSPSAETHAAGVASIPAPPSMFPGLVIVTPAQPSVDEPTGAEPVALHPIQN